MIDSDLCLNSLWWVCLIQSLAEGWEQDIYRCREDIATFFYDLDYHGDKKAYFIPSHSWRVWHLVFTKACRKNTLGNMMSNMGTGANLSQRYTNHLSLSGRREYFSPDQQCICKQIIVLMGMEMNHPSPLACRPAHDNNMISLQAFKWDLLRQRKKKRGTL